MITNIALPRKNVILDPSFRFPLEAYWVKWKPVDGKKIPIVPTGWLDNRESWQPFRQVMETCEAHPGTVGVGLIVCDGMVGGDIDNCLNDPDGLPEIVQDLLRLETYCEVSPSGNGLRFFIYGEIPRAFNLPAIGKEIPRRELYSSRRFMTVTGDIFHTPRPIASGPEAQARLDAFIAKWYSQQAAPRILTDNDILDLARSFKNGDKFSRLFAGDISGYGTPSNADYALVRMFCFITQDPVTIDRLFRRSGLMRPKWEQMRAGQTYGQRTIERALSRPGKVYTFPKQSEESDWRYTKVKTHPVWWNLVLRSYRNPAAWAVLHYLHTLADENGECFPSKPTIRKDLGIGRDKLDKVLAFLKEKRIVLATQRLDNSYIFRLQYQAIPGSLDAL